ncbi:hypothetical protein O9993_09255 [Vibrio lentus]|nr:hypothetical protein [Vibrio lentus]
MLTKEDEVFICGDKSHRRCGDDTSFMIPSTFRQVNRTLTKGKVNNKVKMGDKVTSTLNVLLH